MRFAYRERGSILVAGKYDKEFVTMGRCQDYGTGNRDRSIKGKGEREKKTHKKGKKEKKTHTHRGIKGIEEGKRGIRK